MVLLFALILGIALCLLSSPVSASDAKQANAAPDLICHTDDPKDCYPRIFEATDEFQQVHDDQQLPQGLHVRMDIWTGKKEAKINVPDEVDPALEGLPVDQAMVVVEPQEPVDEPVIPKGAPKYESVGKVKGPEHEALSFHEAMTMLKTGVVAGEKSFDGLLEDMEELSHDIYYGLKIAEDTEVVKSLFCLMADQGAASVDGHLPRDQQAASILSSSLQNNPSSLAEVVKNWKDIMQHPCAKDKTLLRDCLYSSLTPGDTSDKTKSTASAAKLKAKVAAINGLIKDPSIRKEFLESGGMRQLQQILLPEGKEWAGAQRKVGQLALDNFLDEDMGATLGEWPRRGKLDDKSCASSAFRVEEGCWDYHVARIMKANKGDKNHWSRDLTNRLGAIRKKGGPASRIHQEL